MCAGGSLHACDEDRLEKLGGCARVSFFSVLVSIDLSSLLTFLPFSSAARFCIVGKVRFAFASHLVLVRRSMR